MAKKKVISKKKKSSDLDSSKEEKNKLIDALEGQKETELESDVFDIDEVPETEEELSEIEQEISEEEEFEEEIQEERFYVVPLAKKGFDRAPEWKRSKKAVKILRIFLQRHMKPEGVVFISQGLNERIWERGMKHPPRKIRIRVTKSIDGIVRAYVA